jgi:poly(3-hydroxybutyrate) depolymerase
MGSNRLNYGFGCAFLALAWTIGCGEEAPGTSSGFIQQPMAGATGGSLAGQGGAGGIAGAGAGGVAGTIAGVGGAGGFGGAGGAAGMIAGSGGGGASGMTGGAGAGGAGGAMAGAGGAGGMGGEGGEAGTMAGAGGGGGPGMMSAGCGKSDTPGSGTFTIDVAGLEREYIVKIPSGYDPSHAYRLIFTWHYLGGSAAGIAGGFGGGYYGLESRSAGSAIFVSPEGIDAAWPNTGGRDVAFGRAMVDWMRENYCIDNDRIFSTGFSYGGIMSNTAGCAMGDIFRAIAPMAGSGPRSFGGGGCMGEVAAIIFHGQSDNVVSFASGQGSRDHWVEANGCDSTTTPGSPSQCVEYNGCNDGYPVIWCEYPGGHTQPSIGADATWAFFEQF